MQCCCSEQGEVTCMYLILPQHAYSNTSGKFHALVSRLHSDLHLFQRNSSLLFSSHHRAPGPAAYSSNEVKRIPRKLVLHACATFCQFSPSKDNPFLLPVHVLSSNRPLRPLQQKRFLGHKNNCSAYYSLSLSKNLFCLCNFLHILLISPVWSTSGAKNSQFSSPSAVLLYTTISLLTPSSFPSKTRHLSLSLRKSLLSVYLFAKHTFYSSHHHDARLVLTPPSSPLHLPFSRLQQFLYSFPLPPK